MLAIAHVEITTQSASFLNNHWGQYDPTFPLLTGLDNLWPAWTVNGLRPLVTILDPQGVVVGNWTSYTESHIDDFRTAIDSLLPLEAPVLSIERMANGMLRLHWTEVEGAGSYRLLQAATPWQEGIELIQTPLFEHVLAAPAPGRGWFQVEALAP